MPQRIFIDRPPRIEPELPSGIIKIPNPPELEDNPGQMIAQAMLPMAMIFGYILVAAFGQTGSLIMIPMLLSVIASVALAFYVNRQQRKKLHEKELNYKLHINDLRRQMESDHEQQRIYYHYNYPNPEKSLAIVNDLGQSVNRREQDIRSGTRLWERRPSDHDFMYLRLGIGTRASTVVYKISDDKKVENPLFREARRLSEDSRLVFDVPVTVPLFLTVDEKEQKKADINLDQESGDHEAAEQKETSVRHSIGIAGKSPEKVRAYLRTLLVDFTTFHSPQDTVLYITGTNEARQHWRWAYALPHCKEADKSETLYFEVENKPNENEVDRMRLFWKNIRTILERRRMRLQDRESSADLKLPFILVVVDIQDSIPEWSCLHDVEAEPAISTILIDGQTLGAGILFLVPDRSKVPSRCSAVIELDNDPIKNDAAVFRYAETGFNNVRYVGNTKLVFSQEIARNFSKKLEPYDIRRGYGSSLASNVTLLEMLNTTSMADLQKLARENWQRSKDPKSADWLYTAIGLLSGDEPRVLTFSAKADGVHGMIAGSTGSGKSELLTTLILGLAVNFSPDVLNFVLIDYKGGTAFEPFRHLPHKVDIVTNLDQSATARVFASIKAELDRRQELNKQTKSKDIVDYRRKGLNLEPGRPPYPHLFIIIDEFAEMIAGNAEYKAQLESITRLGRALGVTLILAAQRPTGVTDQMRANIKFRICLRVETHDDSRELLRRPDAAFLPPGIPGRGYLQVGNENIELIQTAYSGGDYRGPQEDNSTPNVVWMNHQREDSKQKNIELPKLYDVITAMLVHLATQESPSPQWRPWPEFLPTQTGTNFLTLSTLLDTTYLNDADIDLLSESNSPKTSGVVLNEKAMEIWEDGFTWTGVKWGRNGNAMSPLIGLIDNPYQASQKPLQINFIKGHAVIFGASGRGKTTFLRTVINSLTLTHSPDELHIYILDFGGNALGNYQDLPHVGAVITSEEDERVKRMLRKIDDIVSKRQKIFGAGFDSLDSYNLANPDKRLPAVLVVLDNFAGFKEYYDSLLDPFTTLVRESRAYGVHFLLSADVPNTLSGKLYNLITERYTLKLSDPSEYSSIVGRGVPSDLNEVPGRGYARIGNTPLEFQTALSFLPEGSESGELGQIEKMCTRMKAIWADKWTGEKPSTIETLPLVVSLDTLLKQTPVPVSSRLFAVVGINDHTLQPELIDIERQGPHLVIIGAPFSGKTTLLRTMIISFALRYSPDEFIMVLIDLSRKLWKGSDTSLSTLPHVVDTIADVEELDHFLENMQVECSDFDKNPKRRKVVIFIDNYDSFSDEASRKRTPFFDDLSALVRKYQTSGVYVIIAGSVSILNAQDGLRRVVTSPNFGIALRTSDSVNRLNGKFPRSLADVELPMGRAFTVRSGVTAMFQIATPYANDENIESSLDSWVVSIKQRYPQEKSQWLNQASPEKTKNEKTKKPSKKVDSNNSEPSPEPQTAGTQKYNIEELRKQLIETGMPDSLLAVLSVDDIIEYAKARGIIKE